jgi:hypothetical protein
MRSVDLTTHTLGHGDHTCGGISSTAIIHLKSGSVMQAKARGGLHVH